MANMLHLFLATITLAMGALSFDLPGQQVFADVVPSASAEVNLIHELRRAEIIPAIIDKFTPDVSLSIIWERASAELGNTVPPSNVQHSPEVCLTKVSSSSAGPDFAAGMQLTVVLTDPDAPSRENPEWSQICHWIVTGFKIGSGAEVIGCTANGAKGDAEGEAKTSLNEIMPYKPPGPPPKTGKHRYVFIALAPRNRTTHPLQLSTPSDRQHWGYGEERAGVRRWAEENALDVIGANFAYAQNEEQ